MDNIEISLLVILSVGVVFALFLDFLLPKREHPFQVATLASAIVLDIAAFIPQIIENATIKGATNDIRPSFLILVTISYLMKLPAEKRLVQQASVTRKNVDLVTVQAASIFVPVVFYIIWQFQCAYLNSGSESAEYRGTVLKWTGVLFSIFSVCLLYWLFRPKQEIFFPLQFDTSIL